MNAIQYFSLLNRHTVGLWDFIYQFLLGLKWSNKIHPFPDIEILDRHFNVRSCDSSFGWFHQ